MRLRFALFVLTFPLIFAALTVYMIGSMLALPVVLLAYDFGVLP